MSIQIPKEFAESKETFAKLVTFWARPSRVTKIDTICSVSHVERSQVLRLLLDLFLFDDSFQEKVLRGVSNG